MKKLTVKKIKEKKELMLLIFILIASMIYIRNENIQQIIKIAINIIMITYLIISVKNKKPIKIIKSKIDILVVLLIVSTLVPLICNSYISLYNTIITSLNYITLFWIYILTRETCVKCENNKSIIFNTIILSTIALIVLGIENLSSNKIFEFFEINYLINGESRLVSLFGNPNAFAGLIIFSYFLSIDQAIKAKIEVKKILYSVINTILITGLVLTYSKLMFVIYPVMLIVYMWTLKNRHKNIYIMQNTITAIIIAVLYSYIFNILVAQENYLAVFILSIFTLAISTVCNILNYKMTKYLEKVKIRTILILVSIMIVIVGFFVKIELHKTKEFIVFRENSTINYNAKKIRNIVPNQKYIFSFHMDAKMELERDKAAQDLFIINIIQKDEKNIEITNKEEKFGDFSGLKEIEIQTTENTKEIKIEFKSKYQYAKKQWVIKKLEMNGQEIILEYQNLPTKLIEKIKDINIQYKTAQERFEFIKDGLKIISQNFLTGIGGEGWQYKYEEVQEYDYTTKDTHSYFIQVWLEFGLLGILSLIGIVYIVIIQKEEKYKGLKFAILALLLHCIIDSDMYFFNMKLLLFMSLGILADAKVSDNLSKKNNWINIALCIIPIITIYLYINPKIYNKKAIVNEIENGKVGLYVNSEEYRNVNKKVVKACEDVIKYERSILNNEYEIKKIQACIISGQKDFEDIISQYYEKMLNYKNKCNYNTKRIIEKNVSINSVIEILQNKQDPKLYPWIKKLAKINIDDFEETKKQLENAIKKSYGKIEENEEYQTLLYNNQNALAIYDRFFFEIDISNKTKVDIKSFLPLDKELQMDNKEDIIIYHTHTTEGYIPTDEGKTLDKNLNVLSVGETLKQNLQSKGFNVLHIQDYHDLEGINGAYSRSQDSLEKVLNEQNRKVDLVFDVHRDAFEGDLLNDNSVEIDGKSVANLRFVVAVGHEGWENNLNWAITIQKKADELYPGLFKPLLIYDNTYNQSATKFASLIEVGNNANTVNEAKESINYLAKIIDNVLKK